MANERVADRFKDRVVLVTGAGRGIAKNIALAFASEGARVVICDFDEVAGSATAQEFESRGFPVDVVTTDLSVPGAPVAMVRDVAKRLGRLDVLVNSARSGGNKTPLQDENEASWDAAMSVTLRAAFFTSQEAIRLMSKVNGGAIVNISSIAASVVTGEAPAYHMAKAGVEQMTRYLAVVAGPSGIRVNCVAPGFIVQDENRERYSRADNAWYRELVEATQPAKKVGRSNDVADAVLFLASDQASFVSGEVLTLDGGQTKEDSVRTLFQFNDGK